MGKEEPKLVDLEEIDYEDLRAYLSDLPMTWYPDLIRAMVEAAYKKEVFVRPQGCSTMVQNWEKGIHQHYGTLSKIKLGMTRDEVVAALDEPDAKGGKTRKYPTPCIFKYGDVELHFQPWKNGKLAMVWDEGREIILLK